MKRFFLFIILLAILAAGIYYFIPESVYRTGGSPMPRWNPFASLAEQASSTVNQTAANTANAVALQAQERTQGLIEGTRAAVASQTVAFGGALSQGVSNAINGITENTKEKIAGALGITSDAEKLLAANQLVDLSICSTARGTDINYVITNPFSPQKDFSFRIDWGDSTFSQGSMSVEKEKTPISYLVWSCKRRCRAPQFDFKWDKCR